MFEVNTPVCVSMKPLLNSLASSFTEYFVAPIVTLLAVPINLSIAMRKYVTVLSVLKMLLLCVVQFI